MEDVAYGDGGITKRPDGRLQVAVVIDGRRTYRMVPARLVKADPKTARRMAEAYQRDLVGRRETGLSPSTQTLAAYLRSWVESLRDAKRQRIRSRTLDGYAMIVEQHLIPALGKHRLDRLSEHHIQAWVDAQSASPRTIEHRRAVLRRALNTALRQRTIARNPALALELPEPDEFHGAPLSLEEVMRLFAANADDPLLPLWRLAIDTGARQSELLGLSREDVDTKAGTVTIHSQLQRRGKAWRRVPLKADRAFPVLSLSPETAAALDAHEKRQALIRRDDWEYFGLLFTTPTGQPWFGWTILDRFHEALDRAGLARRRFHDLRGTTATLMRQLGVPEDVRMARLGHSTTDMARHYGQAGVGFDRKATDALADALRAAQ